MKKVALAALLAIAAASCAPKTLTPAPIVSVPRFPEFMAPAVPGAFAGTPAALNQERGWRFLQAGDFKNAEREFATALRTAPAFHPAEAGLGYVELARKDARAALPHFDRALEREKSDLSALIGRGQTLLALEREPDALAAFEAALAVDPSLGDVARRVDVLRFRGQQDELNRARQAARGGRLEDAIAIYHRAIGASPDSAFLYRELAAVERQHGDDGPALEHFRKGLELEPSDARSLIQVAEILGARGDFEGSAKAYAESIAIEPNAEAEAKLEALRARAELARLPAEYRAIGGTAQITRAELAALVGIRLSPLLQASRRRDAVVITDIRNNWAATWIAQVARAGVMEPFANHTFQPRAVVRRVDLAQAVSRLLTRVAEATPKQPHPWQSARLRFSDLTASHLAYPAASVAVASGVLLAQPNNSFQPSRPVTGQEAIDAVGRIEALAPGVLTQGKPVR